MSRKILGISVGVALALAVSLGAYAAATSDEGGSPKPAPTPTVERFDDGEWTIETPTGWTRRVITRDADAKKAVRYDGPNGEYFIVAIDPLGSGYDGDVIYRYEVDGDRFRVVDRSETGADADDSRFDGSIFWKAGADPVQVGGHVWYFQFGDADSATTDTAVFETILESVRVTA